MAWDVTDWLSSLIGPREAEAKVVGDPQAVGIIDRMAKNPSPEYLAQQYRRIAQRAQAAPTTVQVWPNTGDLPSGVAGMYEPATQQITYDPSLGALNLRGTLSHELLHFLNQQSAQPLPDEAQQHAVMETQLGGYGYAPYQERQGATPPVGTPLSHVETFENWLTPKYYETGQEPLSVTLPPVRTMTTGLGGPGDVPRVSPSQYWRPGGWRR